ncbi:hypothetical protein [Rubripirellula tenax]|nr:hypothetical protein [Rubripirellula tenax]
MNPIMRKKAVCEPLKACPRCGIPLRDGFAKTDTDNAKCTCGAMPSDGDEDLSDPLILAIHTSQFRDNGTATGAICGAAASATVATLFTFLPAAWLVWDIQLAWGYFFQPVAFVILWATTGAMLGAAVMRILTAALAPTWLVMQAAVTGFFVGFSLGATIGAACSYVRYIVWQGQSIHDVWFVYSGEVTLSAEFVGFLFAVVGSWGGAILVRSRLDPRLRRTPNSYIGDAASARNGSANHHGDRFQFGIAKMLLFTGVIAVMIAAPVQILRRLRLAGKIDNYILAFEVMAVLVVIMLLPFVVWAMFRWPKLYRQMLDSLARWRRIDHLRP